MNLIQYTIYISLMIIKSYNLYFKMKMTIHDNTKNL